MVYLSTAFDIFTSIQIAGKSVAGFTVQMVHFIISLVLIVPLRLNEVQDVISIHIMKTIDIIPQFTLGSFFLLSMQGILLVQVPSLFLFNVRLVPTEIPSLVASAWWRKRRNKFKKISKLQAGSCKQNT